MFQFHRTSKMKPATTDLDAKFLHTCVVDCWVSEERAALESVPGRWGPRSVVRRFKKDVNILRFDLRSSQTSRGSTCGDQLPKLAIWASAHE